MGLGLLDRNKFIRKKWHTQQDIKKIESMVGIDYLIDFIDERVWHADESPKVVPKNLGYKVIVLRSGTGTGKSSLLAPYLYRKYIDEKDVGIILTQPTRVSTIDIIKQIVLFNSDLVMGQNIGYQTSSQSFKPESGILICTVGILLQFMRIWTDNMVLYKYDFILIDEVHRRSLELDSLLFQIKSLLERVWDNPKCPMFILMSGTFEPATYMSYFGCPQENFLDVIPGNSFPIQITYSPFTVSNYIQYVVDLVETIHINNISDIINKELFRHILVFVHGSAQVDDVVNKIHYLNATVFKRGLEYAKTHSIERKAQMDNNYGYGYIQGGNDVNNAEYYIIPIPLMSKHVDKGEKDYMNFYGKIGNIMTDIYEFDDAGNKTDVIIATVPVCRKAIIGTNAVETGITISELKYCIDTGLVTDIYFNPCIGCNVHTNSNITQDAALQRKGRVGRNAPGQFLTCYTEETFNKMPLNSLPEIVRSDLTGFFLSIVISENRCFMANLTHESNERVIENLLETEDEKLHRLSTSLKVKRSDIGKNSKLKINKEPILNEEGEWVIHDEFGKPIEIDKPYIYDIQAHDTFKMNMFDQNRFAVVNKRTFDGSAMSFMQYPSADSFEYSLEKLHSLGFINHDYTVTLTGWYANRFRKLRPEYVRIILASYQYRAYTLDVVTIACFLELFDKLGFKRKKYKFRDVLDVGNEDEILLNAQLLFGDEIIECLFIFYEVMDIIDIIGDDIRGVLQSKKRKQFNALKITTDKLTDYCTNARIKIDGLLLVIDLRKEIIQDMLSLGLNPFYNGLELPRGKYNLIDILRQNLYEGMEEIRKIKHCIMEGHRFNICIWNQDIGKYVNTYLHAPILIDSPLLSPIPKKTAKNYNYARATLMHSEMQQKKPKVIIVAAIMMREGFNSGGLFELSGDGVSVMDGFVDIDMTFLYN